MNTITPVIKNYLEFCAELRRLDAKTIRAYKTDLQQLNTFFQKDLSQLKPEELNEYIRDLHTKYKPKTVKRKIASVKSFYHYLERNEIIPASPFHKIQVSFREPILLPKTIPLHNMESLLSTIYQQLRSAPTAYRQRNALRDAAVCELLFATGMRISELCSLHPSDIDFYENTILIFGKGSKERRIQIGNKDVILILKKYCHSFRNEIKENDRFFVSQSSHPFSDQAVRRMINKYADMAAIEQHITPHMFRHTFATALLEADVDIRYIQEMLGHSSITTTEIYTHVTLAKQKDILTNKHPRKNFNI